MGRPDRAPRHDVPGIVRIAVVWTVVLSAGLLVYVTVTGIGIGAVLLALPFAAAALAWLWPRSIGALLAADLLLAGTVVILLIGGEGLLYLPPLVLLVVATWSAVGARGDRRAASPLGG